MPDGLGRGAQNETLLGHRQAARLRPVRRERLRKKAAERFIARAIAHSDATESLLGQVDRLGRTLALYLRDQVLVDRADCPGDEEERARAYPHQ